MKQAHTIVYAHPGYGKYRALTPPASEINHRARQAAAGAKLKLLTTHDHELSTGFAVSFLPPFRCYNKDDTGRTGERMERPGRVTFSR